MRGPGRGCGITGAGIVDTIESRTKPVLEPGLDAILAGCSLDPGTAGSSKFLEGVQTAEDLNPAIESTKLGKPKMQGIISGEWTG
jgi:hypothetical protein